ncbi:MAG: iron ABC transporter permease [Clostridia bacterium]|nr:iron ABC transporter permease [Clostridia bacterium]
MNSSVIFSKNKRQSARLICSAVLSVAIVLALSIIFGSSRISPGAVLSGLVNGAESVDYTIFKYVRLPRALSCFFAGAALAASGAVIQRALSNKLASPGIIGVNSGSVAAVTLCTSLGIWGGWTLSLAAFLGAFLSVCVVVAASVKFKASRGAVILLGIAMNSLFGAVTDAIVTFVPDTAYMTTQFRVGDFSSSSYSKLIPAAVIITVTVTAVTVFADRLDLITLGDDVAKGLGLSAGVTRMLYLTAAALLAGCAVSMAGLLSFVGLIVPHAVKRLHVTDGKMLLPLCAILGGGFVTLCDLVARTAFAPYEIPVGIIMSVFGVPVFLILLFRGKESERP